MDNHVIATRALLSCRQAVLATHSCNIPGFPLTSVVPVGISYDGHVLVLISELAQHTRNLQLDTRMSLMLHDDQEHNWQATTRLSVIGHLQALRPDDQQLEHIRRAYYRMHPELDGFDQQMDFSFWQLKPLRYRLIAGFAQVRWLDQVDPRLFHLEDQDYQELEALLPEQQHVMRILHVSHFGVQVIQQGRIHFLSFLEPVSSLAGAALKLRTGSFQDLTQTR